MSMEWNDYTGYSALCITQGSSPIWIIVQQGNVDGEYLWYPAVCIRPVRLDGSPVPWGSPSSGERVLWSGKGTAGGIDTAKADAVQGALSWLRAQVAGLESMEQRAPLVPDADDCARPPRDICDGAMIATAERLLWPPPAMCEGEPIWRIGTGGVGVWSTLPVLTRIRLAVLMNRCKLNWVAVYSGPPVEALRPVCDGRALAHEECFGA